MHFRIELFVHHGLIFKREEWVDNLERHTIGSNCKIMCQVPIIVLRVHFKVAMPCMCTLLLPARLRLHRQLPFWLLRQQENMGVHSLQHSVHHLPV